MPWREALRDALTNPDTFSRMVPARRLRTYQANAAAELARGLTDPTPDGLMVMLFSRQAGKDELLAQLTTFLLLLHSRRGGSIVMATPTKTPQADIAYERALNYARNHPLTKRLVRGNGYQIFIGNAKATYVSAGPNSNARGQTASIALIANEAQDIDPARWDAVFDPMAASTNAPTIFSGTIWTPDTLLSRQLRYAESLQEADGRQRVHRVAWKQVAAELPAYGERVRARMKQLGENHPFIQTEYELIELNSGATMFTAQRLSMLEGAHPRQRTPMPGQRVVFLIDVAGADEAVDEGGMADPHSDRDSTVLTILDLDQRGDLPRYKVLDRATFLNQPWATTEGAITLLMERWKPIVSVIDATGIGHGMWQRLTALNRRRRIEPFVFTSKSKSDIGWRTIGIIDSGRVQEYAPDGEDDTTEHWWQLRHITSSVRPGPNQLLTYGIPSSVGHDDSALSFMLLGFVDELDLRERIARGS